MLREFLKEPKPTSVAGLSTIMPEFWSAIKVINIPIPAATAFFKLAGIDLIIASRTFISERRINKTPSKKTTVKAEAGENPIFITTL